jgi:transcriptional regulator with XRE-family HTH domain
MISPAQCRMARAALAIGVRELAGLAGVSAMTVTRFENGHSQGYPDTHEKLRRALEAAGVIFVEENGEGPGVRLRKARPAISDEAAIPETPKDKPYDGSPM